MTATEVDAYISKVPVAAQAKLKEIRVVVKDAAPDAIESISYGMPYYSFKGESGFKSRLCYFGLTKSKKRIAFYTRPIFLEEYSHEVKPYLTSKSALQFPLDRSIPIQLIKRLVRNGMRKHKNEMGRMFEKRALK